MRKCYLPAIAFLLACNVFSQEELIVKDSLNTQKICPQSDNIVIGAKIECYNVITFSTNEKNFLYEKWYDETGKLVKEGSVILKRKRIKRFSKKVKMGYKEGIWKYYDYERNEIKILKHRHYISEYGEDQDDAELINWEKMIQ